jgi:hypothetical protein
MSHLNRAAESHYRKTASPQLRLVSDAAMLNCGLAAMRVFGSVILCFCGFAIP